MKVFKEIGIYLLGALTLYVVIIGINLASIKKYIEDNLNVRIEKAEKSIANIEQFLTQQIQIANQARQAKPVETGIKK